jgi:hypothetical protein
MRVVRKVSKKPYPRFIRQGSEEVIDPLIVDVFEGASGR